MAERNNGIESNEPKTFQASTVGKIGDWLQSNGAGEFEPLEPGNTVEGLLQEAISTTDPNYASEKQVIVDGVTADTDRFLMKVGTGTATAEMEGLSYDVDAADASVLDVSGAGTQFQITRFISDDTVEVKVNFPSADLS